MTPLNVDWVDTLLSTAVRWLGPSTTSWLITAAIVAAFAITAWEISHE